MGFFRLSLFDFASTNLHKALKPCTSSLTASPTLLFPDRSLWRLWDATLDREYTSVEGQLN